MFKYKSIINELKQLLSEGRLVLFCGAGISKDYPSCLPLFKEYKETVIDLMSEFLSLQDNSIHKEDIILLKNSEFPPEKFMQGIYHEWGRKSLIFTDVFGKKQFQSNINHKIISELTKIGLKIILTTNFDKLIESELSKYNFEVVETQSTIKDFANQIKSNQHRQKPILVKLHGSAGNHEEIIITLNQVGKPNPEKKALISFLLEQYVFLFIGYSGNDFDLFPIILEASKRAQSIYWTFYPGNRGKEVDIENQLKREYKERFIPIEIKASDLLQKLLPKKQQMIFIKHQKDYDRENNKNSTQTIYKNLLKKDIQLQITDVDIRRIYEIFAGFALYLGKLDAEERFLKDAWEVNKNAEDHKGMAYTASMFVSLYRSQLSKYDSQLPKTTLETFLNIIENWRDELYFYGKLIEDHTVKGDILVSDGIYAFLDENDLIKADKCFKEAIDHYNQIENEYNELKYNRIGAAYLNLGHCYVNISLDPKTNIVKEEQFDKAKDYLEKAELYFTKVGSLSNLAETYFFLGKAYFYKDLYNDANDMDKKALEIYEKTDDIVGKAIAYKAIGYTYRYKKNLSKALINLIKSAELFKTLKDFRNGKEVNQAIKEVKNKIDHIGYNILPNVVTNLKDLAKFFKIQGNYIEAKSLNRIAKKLYRIVNNIVRLNLDRDYQQVESLSEQNRDYQNVAENLNKHVEKLCEQDKDVKDEPLYKRALQILNKQLEEDPLYVATIMNNLAGLFEDHGKFVEAEPLYLRALEIREKQVGKKHPDYAQSLHNLAELYRVQRKFNEAEPLYKQAIRTWKITFDPQLAYSLIGLASLYSKQGNYSTAIPLYQQALEILELKLGKSHRITKTVRDNFKNLLHKIESLEKRN